MVRILLRRHMYPIYIALMWLQIPSSYIAHAFSSLCSLGAGYRPVCNISPDENSRLVSYRFLPVES